MNARSVIFNLAFESLNFAGKMREDIVIGAVLT